VELSKYIKDILISRDNVIIPNFGAFEKTMLSARIDPNSGEMHPPQIGVVFRNDLKVDSGVLVKYIAEKENVGEDKIIEEIRGQVLLWEESLNQGQQVLLSGIGTLIKDSSGNITFESAITAADFPESYGLPIINIKEKSVGGQPVEKKTEVIKPEIKKPEVKKVEVKKTPIKQRETIIPETKKTTKSNKKLVVALIIVVPIVALIVLGALNFDYVKKQFNKTSQYVSGIISNKNVTDSTIGKSAVLKDSLSIDSTGNETKAILENYTIIDESTNTKLTPDSKDLDTFKKVHIIAGSFKIKSFANRHRNILIKKGFKAEVLPENKGLFRVSVASFNDVESAAKDFDRIKAIDESMNYWILVNK
jgi:hypothetical protein